MVSKGKIPTEKELTSPRRQGRRDKLQKVGSQEKHIGQEPGMMGTDASQETRPGRSDKVPEGGTKLCRC